MAIGLGLIVACVGLERGQAATQSAHYTAWQELVLLTVAKVGHAAAVCGFRENVGQVDVLLASADLSHDDLQPKAALSDSMRRQIQADADGYGGDREAACDEAWSRYGADGSPGLRDLLFR